MNYFGDLIKIKLNNVLILKYVIHFNAYNKNYCTIKT
jgi:hypothetical protein